MRHWETNIKLPHTGRMYSSATGFPHIFRHLIKARSRLN